MYDSFLYITKQFNILCIIQTLHCSMSDSKIDYKFIHFGDSVHLIVLAEPLFH